MGGVSLQGGGVQFTAELSQWSIGNVGSCRLVDYFNVAPIGSLSDPQLRLSMGLASCVWGQRGHFWLEQTLTAGGTVHFLSSGAGMSMQFSNNLYWQPVRELKINIGLTFNGTYDTHNGWNGSVGFGSDIRIIDAKSAFIGAGIHF